MTTYSLLYTACFTAGVFEADSLLVVIRLSLSTILLYEWYFQGSEPSEG